MAEAGMPPIEATEKNPVFVCREPPSGERTWIIVATAVDKTRDCGNGSVAVWNGAIVQVQFVDAIVAAPVSAVKSKTKLSISPTSIGSNGMGNRISISPQ